MEDKDGGAQCLICQDNLLELPACALRCGHVYHATCCHEWLEKGKGECPQCKQKAHIEDLRLLDFEVAKVQPQSLQEVRRLQSASAEEREQLRQELQAEAGEVLARVQEAAAELERQQQDAQERKRARRELEQQRPREEAELNRLGSEKEHKLLMNASLGAQVDHQNSRQRQSRSRTWSQSSEIVNEDDPDAREERRKLRTMRPDDRARQLHGAVVSAREQEAETIRISLARETALQALEEELVRLRRLEAKLARELRECREEEELPSEVGGVGTAGAGAKPTTELSKAAPCAGGATAGRHQQAADGPPCGMGPTEAPPHDDSCIGEDDLLYGGPPKRSTSAGLLAHTARASPAARTTGTPAVALVATATRKPGCLQVLFSKRKL